MHILLAKTAQSCGISSRCVDRRTLATRVTRGSTPPASSVLIVAPVVASSFATMLRKLKIVNVFPNAAVRRCRYRIGLGDSSRIATPTHRIIGEKSTSANVSQRTSDRRLSAYSCQSHGSPVDLPSYRNQGSPSLMRKDIRRGYGRACRHVLEYLSRAESSPMGLSLKHDVTHRNRHLEEHLCNRESAKIKSEIRGVLNLKNGCFSGPNAE